MKFSPVSASIKIKLLLVLIAAVIAISTLIYTQNLVSKLQNRETEIVKLYASSLEFIANSETSNLDYTFIFQNIIQRIDFPLILTDADDLVSSPVDEGGFKNIQIDSTLSSDKKTEFIQEMVKKLAQEHEPISVKTPDGIVLQKIYYGDSEVIRQLRYYPFAQIIIAFIFILIAYVSFSYIKRTEQSNIWVGMSKETAHQLGTPISSLMGWNEMLKLNFNNPDKVLDTSNEIDSDLERLNKITKRFSKIGSKPELKEQNLYEVIQKVVNYFHRRIPQLGK
ncbi:MAG: sensor histidine kinase, partial [Ignavibacteria bacterium]|nr:sensor histidine kinase [Ignavibacteria bacterium]